MLDHLSIQCADLAASAAFYDAVLAELGGRRIMDYGGTVGYGTSFPCFWLSGLQTGEGFRESHIAFRAPSREAVDAFYRTATERGAEGLHAPRLWPEYHAGYYGAFVRDPDGNNVEAVHHTMPAQSRPPPRRWRRDLHRRWHGRIALPSPRTCTYRARMRQPTAQTSGHDQRVVPLSPANLASVPPGAARSAGD